MSHITFYWMLWEHLYSHKKKSYPMNQEFSKCGQNVFQKWIHQYIWVYLFYLDLVQDFETCTLRKKIEENNYKNVMGTPNICTYMEKLCGKKNSLYTLFSQISQCSHNEHCNTLQQHVQVGSRIIFSCFYHKVRP